MNHVEKNHKMTLIQPDWASSKKTIRDKAKNIIFTIHAKVDLWLCNDCKQHFIHDWNGNEYRDVRVEL